MAGAAQDRLGGFRLLVAMAAGVALGALGLAALGGFDVDGVRMSVRFTARTSLLLFLSAFTAAALHRLWPSPLTAWQRRNRRYLGLSFAASHGLHGLALIVFALMAPAEFRAATSLASFVFGGIGYAFIAAMAATSFDRSAAAIGPLAWRGLHTIGAWYIFAQFLVSFGMRVPGMPSYLVFIALLTAALAIRLIAPRAQKVARPG